MKVLLMLLLIASAGAYTSLEPSLRDMYYAIVTSAIRVYALLPPTPIRLAFSIMVFALGLVWPVVSIVSHDL